MAIATGQPGGTVSGLIQPIDVASGTLPPNQSNPNALPPPTGETPLTTAPTWQNGPNAANANNLSVLAFQDFVQQFGRNPTQSELNSLIPSYQSGDPNIANNTGGKAAVANYFQQLSNTPQNIYSQQQSQNQANAGKYANNVTQEFQQQLGRAPTQDELSYYGSLMASGQQGYQIGQALQQTQEYQNAQNTNFQNQLQGQLQQSNSTYFNQYIAPSLQAQNALSGQAPGSSALSSQLSQAALQQNQGLQDFLAGVTSQNYQNSVGNATNQYNQLMGQQYGLQNAGVTNALTNQQNNQAYNQQLNMYQLQQQAYNNYLNQYGKRQGNQGLGQLAGGLAGAGLGAYFGGPKGAQLGYGLGSGFGGSAGALL